MSNKSLADPRAWTAATIDSPANWYYSIPAACLAAFAQEKERLSGPLTEYRLGESDRGEGARAVESIRQALEAGRGFAIIEPPVGKPLMSKEAQLLYWLLGQALGRPVEQNVQGTLLYDVRDTGQPLEKGARFSVTSYESSFHTDNSFGEEVVDYVGLLCLQTAKTGGRSQIVSGLAVYSLLQAEHPEVLPTLMEAFQVERRGGVRAGEAPTIPVPIFQFTGRELLIRYLRYWIEAGHARIGQPLSSAQTKALDILDAVLGRQELRVEFDLKPGQMYFINNRWIAHNRTAFADHSEPDRRRHLVRLWLAR
jgi:hypothetical protein